MREYDLSNVRWRKSSYSDGNGGSCVEVSHADHPGFDVDHVRRLRPALNLRLK